MKRNIISSTEWRNHFKEILRDGRGGKKKKTQKTTERRDNIDFEQNFTKIFCFAVFFFI